MPPTMYFIQNDILYTTNNGKDNNIKPYIPFEEFLEDCCWMKQEHFNELLKEIYDTEVKYMPQHFKSKAVAIIVDWRKNFKLKKEKFINSL